MMATDLFLYEFKPLYLTLDRIGPFQDKPYCIDFTDDQHQPCNLYFLVSANGFGKTTLLETLASLIGLLDQPQATHFGIEDLDQHTGRAQLDLWLRVHWQGRDHTLILSIIAGRLSHGVTLHHWDEEQLGEHSAGNWHRITYAAPVPGHLEKPRASSELIEDLLILIQNAQGERPNTFGNGTLMFPTVLFFSAYRDIPPVIEHRTNGPGNYSALTASSQPSHRTISQPKHWGYHAIQRFASHDQQWPGSLDNLLVWLKWLNDGRFEQAQKFINKHVFAHTNKVLKEIRRDPPEAIIQCDSQYEHRLDQLSGGEKSLTHLCLRMGAHLTANTIVIIDELEAHLHPAWQHRLLNTLSQLIQENSGLTVITSTHSSELLERFTASLNLPEEGLRKGGHLIENNFHE